MKRRIPTPAEVYDPVTAAVEAALRRREQSGAVEAARARAAELRAAVEADRAARAYPGGGWCGRCGDEYPARWADAVGVAGLPAVCCARCASPQAGSQGEGWSRPVLQPYEVEGVLLSRLLGLPDIPWLTSWARARFGLTFSYATGPQQPWAHVDVEAWREVGRRAADRQRAFGGPYVTGVVVGGTSVDGWRLEQARRRGERQRLAASGNTSPAGFAMLLQVEDAPWTDQQLADAEEAAVQLRLAALDAEAGAKADRIAADAVAAERGAARYQLRREFARAQREREKDFRALLATG